MKTPAILALALLASSCGDAPAPPAPPAPPPLPAPVPPAAPSPAPPGDPDPQAATKPPLPVRPKGEADRLRGLVHLLEWGDTPLVEFAQETLATFPDLDAAAAALREAGERGLVTNLSLVQNVLGAVHGPALGARLEPFLVRCFAAEDPQVRRLSVMLYAQSAAKPDPATVARFAGDSWGPVAMSALRGLDVLGGPPAAAALREAYPRLRPDRRAAACNALGRLGDRASIPLLRAVLAEARRGGDAAASLLFGAAQGLARLGDAEGLDELRRYALALPLDRPAVPLDYPAEEWDGPEAILGRAADAAFRGRLLQQARKGSPAAAAAALRVLTLFYPPDGEIAAAVGAALDRGDADFILVAEALDALRARNAADGTARALASLESPAEERRYGAALALGRWKDPATVPALAARLTKDPALDVRRKVCDALGMVGDPKAAPPLVAFLAAEPEPAPDRALQAMAARANLVGAIADAAADALVSLATGKASTAVRFNAALALGRAAKSPRVRPALESLLRDPSAPLRAAAAESLGRLGDPASRDAVAGAYAREADADTAAVELEAVLRIDLRNP